MKITGKFTLWTHGTQIQSVEIAGIFSDAEEAAHLADVVERFKLMLQVIEMRAKRK